jgi:hypothetical protein
VTRANRTDAFLRLSIGSTVHGEVCWQYGTSVGEILEAPMAMRDEPLRWDAKAGVSRVSAVAGTDAGCVGEIPWEGVATHLRL